MKKDRIMVKAGEEKKMAVQSPRGTLYSIPASRMIDGLPDLATASKITSSRIPPRIP